jgi:hypothetical protein
MENKKAIGRHALELALQGKILTHEDSKRYYRIDTKGLGGLQYSDYNKKDWKPSFMNMNNFFKTEWTVLDGGDNEVSTVDFPLTRTFYMYGHLEAQGLLDKSIDDLDQVEAICVEIAKNWENGVDVQNFEEEGYPTAYAERVLLERYGRNKEKDEIESEQEMIKQAEIENWKEANNIE